MSLTHTELCERARRWLGGPGRCPITLVEFVAAWAEIPDAIGFRNGGQDSVLIECKASRSDFLRDGQKRHRQAGVSALGSYRYYLSEPDIIRPEDLPERWGLLWVKPRGLRLVAGADPGRHYWPAETDVWRWPAGPGERALMFSALQRLKLSMRGSSFRDAVHRTYSEKGVRAAAE